MSSLKKKMSRPLLAVMSCYFCTLVVLFAFTLQRINEIAENHIRTTSQSIKEKIDTYLHGKTIFADNLAAMLFQEMQKKKVDELALRNKVLHLMSLHRENGFESLRYFDEHGAERLYLRKQQLQDVSQDTVPPVVKEAMRGQRNSNYEVLADPSNKRTFYFTSLLSQR